MRDSMRRLGVLVLTVSIVISLSNPRGETQRSPFISFQQQNQEEQNKLEYNFYHEKCPKAEEIIRTTMKELYSANRSTPPQLLRLLFHDCFIGGCDASILLDKNFGEEKIEKEAVPNQTLKGFEKIEIIKSRLEKSCPGTVSCADTLALATREGIVLAGGPFYPLLTGRRDSNASNYAEAIFNLPSPTDNIAKILTTFALKGFNERETVSLLGAHSIGSVDCQFIRNRLYNFSGTGKPDPTIPVDFLIQMRVNCPDRNSTSNGVSVTESQLTSVGMVKPSMGMMSYEALSSSKLSGTSFDTHYYQSLLRGRGLLFSDQQLMAGQETARLVSAYASDDGSAFRRDFARAMMKMSNLGVLSGSEGYVRVNCSKIYS